MAEGLFWEAAPKAVLYAALLPALGACSARWLLLPRLGGFLPPASIASVEHSLSRIGFGSALVVVAATIARAWTHTIVAFGVADAQTWEAIRVVALESRWGGGWQVQSVAALSLAASYAVVRVAPRSGWGLAAASGMALCVALPLLGHAAGSPGRMAIHAAHLAGAGLWLGTLLSVWGVARLEGRRGARERGEAAAAPVLFQQFSTLALLGAAVISLAGLAAAVLYVGTLPALWTTPYGRMLTVKLGLVAAIVACGFANWRWFAASDANRPALPASVPLEVALAVAVALATSVLSELEHPG